MCSLWLCVELTMLFFARSLEHYPLSQGAETEIRGGLAVKFTAGDTLGLQLGMFIRRNLRTQNSFACLFVRLDWMRYIFNVSFDAGRIPASEGAVNYRFGEMVDRRFRLPSW